MIYINVRLQPNMTYEDTDNMEYQSLYRLVKSLITQIPDNCYLYIGPDIYRLIDEEVCLDFLDFGVALDNDYEWYCERFSLSQQCKEYLLSEDNFLIMMYYFCHYMIRYMNVELLKPNNKHVGVFWSVDGKYYKNRHLNLKE